MLLMKTMNISKIRVYTNDITQKGISLLLEEFKAENVVSLDVKNKSSVTDTMIISSAGLLVM